MPPRIYYHKKELQGKAIETKVINLKTFNYILQYKQRDFYNVDEKSTMILKDGVLELAYIDMFEYCTIRKDDITYDAKEGSFYLPDAIILYDVKDAPFPSEFYFIARISNQLEICRCNGGEDIKWYHVPDRITTVEDTVIIKKVEETITSIQELIAYEVEQQQEKEADSAAVIANRKALSEEKKAAYITLTELCMPDSPRKEEVLSFIEGLKQYNEDEAYGTAYNEFRMYLNRNSISFIITIGWNEPVGELEAWVCEAVEENFNKTFQFDHKGEYEDSTVSDDGLFPAFDHQLRKIDLQISMIETDGDEYQLIVHPVNAVDKVVGAMAIMGISQDSIPD